jgi:hypothetical protein
MLLPTAAAAGRKPQIKHEPLDCMKRYRYQQFPIIAWAFHRKGGGDYNEQYMKVVKGAGFNATMDVSGMLDPAHKQDMKVLVAALWYDVPKLAELVKRTKDHPANIGYDLWDNAWDVPTPAVRCAEWMLENCPGLIAYYAENPNPRKQSGTPIRILSTQNYAFSYNNRRSDVRKRKEFCHSLEIDRQWANHLGMTHWPIMAGLANYPVSPSEMSFQVYSAMAYGAQGLVSFAYSVNREYRGKDGVMRKVWGPNEHGVNYQGAKYANQYVIDVVGSHVIGCRSIGVYHTDNGGDTPRGALQPRPGHLVENMDGALMAGVLVLEKDFKSGAKTPAYVMVVDKRTVFWTNDRPPDRRVTVEFGPQIKAVQVLNRDGTVSRSQPGKVTLTLKGGDGRLLKVIPASPESIPPALYGPAGAKAHAALVRQIKAYRQLVAQGGVELAVFDKATSSVRGALEHFEQTIEKPGGRARLEKEERLEMAKQLATEVQAIRIRALRPVMTPRAGAFVDLAEVALSTAVKGAEIRYTLDGSDPAEKGKVYTGPIRLTDAAAIKAVAELPGRVKAGSPSAEGAYRKLNARGADRVSRLRPGLTFTYAEGKGRSLADAARLKATKTGLSETFDTSPWAGKDRFAVTFTGYIKVPADGAYTFYLTSDDGSSLHIGELLVVNNDGRHPPRTASGAVGLRAGLHPVKVAYFEDVGDEMLKVEYEGPGIKRQEIPASVLFRKP